MIPLRERSLAHAALAATVAASAATSSVATDLKRGDPAPPLELRAIDGTPITSEQLEGKVLLLLFGEAGQEKTQLACTEIAAHLGNPHLADEPIEWVLVLSKSSRAEDLPATFGGAAIAPRVVHDRDRTAFGAYGIVVAPTAVVVDRERRVVHALAGFSSRFTDIVLDALLLADGRIGPERFEQTLHPSAALDRSERRLRAQRVVQLARRLAAGGFDDLAEARFREALELDPDSIKARLGLAGLDLARGRYDEAEARYREVLGTWPAATEASLGLARVWLTRDRDRLDEARALVESVLEREPTSAEAHYLLGRIQERQGEVEPAVRSYRRAAELLLRRLGPEGLVQSEAER